MARVKNGGWAPKHATYGKTGEYVLKERYASSGSASTHVERLNTWSEYSTGKMGFYECTYHDDPDLPPDAEPHWHVGREATTPAGERRTKKLAKRDAKIAERRHA